jgi:hypothetical protein
MNPLTAIRHRLRMIFTGARGKLLVPNLKAIGKHLDEDVIAQ